MSALTSFFGVKRNDARTMSSQNSINVLSVRCFPTAWPGKRQGRSHAHLARPAPQDQRLASAVSVECPQPRSCPIPVPLDDSPLLLSRGPGNNSVPGIRPQQLRAAALLP